MCYHVSTPSKAVLKKYLGEGITIDDYQPHYHSTGFKHEALPAILSIQPNKVLAVTWGFTPEQMDDAEATRFFKGAYSLNAKAETIFTQPLYKYAAAYKRCITIVDGFFEWKHEGEEKIPHYIQMPDHKPFALAGLWADRGGELTLNILTTPANELMASIHNTKKRMPFILPEDHWELWLDTSANEADVKKIIHKFPEGLLDAHEISRMITQKGVDSDVPDVQEKIS